MQYVNGEATVLDEYDEETFVQTVWQFSDREFKRQLQKVANGGEFDLSTGKVIAQVGYSLEDINDQNEAQDLLSYDFATKAQRDKRDTEVHNSLIDCGIEKPMNDDQLDTFLSRG